MKAEMLTEKLYSVYKKKKIKIHTTKAVVNHSSGYHFGHGEPNFTFFINIHKGHTITAKVSS